MGRNSERIATVLYDNERDEFEVIFSDYREVTFTREFLKDQPSRLTEYILSEVYRQQKNKKGA